MNQKYNIIKSIPQYQESYLNNNSFQIILENNLQNLEDSFAPREDSTMQIISAKYQSAIALLASQQKSKINKGLLLVKLLLQKNQQFSSTSLRIQNIIQKIDNENSSVINSICNDWILKNYYWDELDIQRIFIDGFLHRNEQYFKIYIEILSSMYSSKRSVFLSVVKQKTANPLQLFHYITILKQLQIIDQRQISLIIYNNLNILLQHKKIRNIFQILNLLASFSIFKHLVKDKILTYIIWLGSKQEKGEIQCVSLEFLQNLKQTFSFEQLQYQIKQIIIITKDLKNTNIKYNILAWLIKLIQQNEQNIQKKFIQQIKQVLDSSKVISNYQNLQSRMEKIGQNNNKILETDLQGTVKKGIFDKLLKMKESDTQNNKKLSKQTKNIKQINKIKNNYSNQTVSSNNFLQKNIQQQIIQTNCFKNINQTKIKIQKFSPKKQILPFFHNQEELCNLEFLKLFKRHRSQREAIYLNSTTAFEDIVKKQEDLISEDIPKIFKKELARKMLSLDYRKAYEACICIAQICKNPKNYLSFKQIYDVVLKWIYYRVFGGGRGQYQIIQKLIPEILLYIEKNHLCLTQNEIITIIKIYREFLITDNRAIISYKQAIQNVYKMSSDRILKNIIRQYQIDLTKIHTFLEQQSNNIYRINLSKILKQLSPLYLNNKQIMEQLKNIRQINDDAEFLSLIQKNLGQRYLIESKSSKNFRHSISGTSISILTTLPQQKIKYYEDKKFLQLPSNSSLNTSINIINKSLTNISVRLDQNLMDLLEESLGKFEKPSSSDILTKYLNDLKNLDQKTHSFFNQLLAQQKYLPSVEKYTEIIFITLFKAILNGLNNRSNISSFEKLLMYILLLQSALKIKNFIKKIQPGLQYILEILMKQLVFEDENKIQISKNITEKLNNFKGDQYVKAINGLILRLLQNVNQTKLFTALLNLFIKQSKFSENSKLISLITKCILKIHNSKGDQSQQKLLNLFQSFYRYTTEFKPKPEDIIFKIIKSFILNLTEIYQSKIWYYYQQSIKCNDMSDSLIKNYLQSLKISRPQRVNNQTKNINMKKLNDANNLKRINDISITSKGNNTSDIRQRIAQMKMRAQKNKKLN